MPLMPGNSPAAVHSNIAQLMHEGRPHLQAIAIALDVARRSAAHRAAGGYNPPSPSLEERMYLHDENSRPFTGGLINSAVPGRTDQHNLDVPAGSYVLPADVVSGLGEGNTMAGAAVVQKMLATAPYGVPLQRGSGRGMPIPAPPPPYRGDPEPPPTHFGFGGMAMPGHQALAGPPGLSRPPSAMGSTAYLHAPSSQIATGGAVMPAGPAGPALVQSFALGGGEDHGKGFVPIVAAGGEIVIPPDIVRNAIGHGDIAHGHDVLDAFVHLARKNTIKTLRNLPGPAK